MRATFFDSFDIGYGVIRAFRNLTFGLLFTTGMAQAETVVIAAMGDSLTAGYGLPTADGFVPQLQDWLAEAELDVEIRNAGVSGDTTAGGLSRVDWTLTPDVDGVIVAFGGNDYLRGLDPDVSRENLRGILEKAAAAEVDVLLVGLTVGNNYGPDYKAQFESIYPELATTFDAAVYPNFFVGLTDAAGAQDRVRDYMQADGIHPNAKGVRSIVDAMGPDVADFVKAITE